MQRFVRGAKVDFLYDLDSHAVQVIHLDVPTFNVPVWKWSQPHALHNFVCCQQQLRTSAESLSPDLRKQVREAISREDSTSALQIWSAA